MNRILKLFVFALLIFTYSCKDTKKEETTIKTIEKIESIEIATDSITDDLQKEAQDLEKALNEL